MTLTARPHVDLEVQGEPIRLLACRGALLPARSTLLIADLHVGKSEAYRAWGVPVPAGITDDALHRLRQTILANQVRRLLVLGDLVHAAKGLTGDVVAGFAAWRSTLNIDVVLVRGNHDRRIVMPPEWRLDDAGAALEEGPFRFVHDACDANGLFTWCGHLHPTVRLVDRFSCVRLPCFHISPRNGTLPAYNAFSRGLVVERAEGDRVFAVAEGAVIEV